MAKDLEKKREKNAFQKGIRNVSWMLIGFMVVMIPVVSCHSPSTLTLHERCLTRDRFSSSTL